jgi:hypothetical protein
MSQVLTANRLIDGEVVYLNAQNGWSEGLTAACALATPAEQEAALAIGAKSERELLVVNPYLFDVVGDAAALKPVKMREIIRAAGPTVRTDLGKQARA